MAGQVTSRSLVQAYERTVPALNQSYSRNGLNQYTNVGGAAFAYSGGDGARGNLTSDGARSFDYDLENRLLSVSGSASGALSYDPLGRIRSYDAGGATALFLYDGDRLVEEYSGAGALLRRYAHGPGVDEPLVWYEGAGVSDPRWLIADRQGSIVATTNASGAATTYGYDPYGVPREWAGSRFRYTGQIVMPELQLYHYKARAYDPALGRFLQTDPVGYEDDLNLYAYVRNDPLNHFDSTGGSIDCIEQGNCDTNLQSTGGGAAPRPQPQPPASPAPANDNDPGGNLQRPQGSDFPWQIPRSALGVFLGTLLNPTPTAGPEDDEIGRDVYRVYGNSLQGNPNRSFWSAEDPRMFTEGDWRSRYAVPGAWNAADSFVHGWVNQFSVLDVREVDPLRFGGVTYGGGGVEVILVDPNVNVIVLEDGPMVFMGPR